MGHIIDSTGLRPLPEKVQAVISAPKPRNTTELKAYLGLQQFYNRFLLNLATIIIPLNALLKKGVHYKCIIVAHVVCQQIIMMCHH